MSAFIIQPCSMHDSFQQMSMSVKRAMTAQISALTDLAAMSACVLKGSCYLKMDGIVSVSQFHPLLMIYVVNYI